MTGDPDTTSLLHRVDPARLASGSWCHQAQKTVGQGDISASYSADRIGMGEPVRKPFEWNGGLWVCVGIRHCSGQEIAEAYRLVHPQMYDGRPLTYAARFMNAEAARADPAGFYHGMSAKHGGAAYVLCGPPVTFAPGETAQLSLF
jgi:hypothetical protein